MVNRECSVLNNLATVVKRLQTENTVSLFDTCLFRVDGAKLVENVEGALKVAPRTADVRWRM